MKEVVLFGGGGHAVSCIDVIKSDKKFRIAGIVDKKKIKMHNLIYLGSDKDIKKLKKKYNFAFISIGQIKSSEIRKKLFNKLTKAGFKFPYFLSKKAIISSNVQIGSGTIVMHGAILNSGSKIGKNCIINTGAIVEHGVKVADNCHLAPRSVINGDVNIKEGTFIGSGAIIRENIIIGKNCIIGANSFVKKSLSNSLIYKNEK